MEIRKKLTDPDFIPDQSVDEVAEGMSRLHAKDIEITSPLPDVIDCDTTEFRVNEDLGSLHQNDTKMLESKGTMGQSMRNGSQKNNRSMLETTYNASYKTGNTKLRSGDLARTLGKSQDRNMTFRARGDILVD